MNRLSSAGDTIVEVLLAILIVSAVLGGAYASANRSLNNTRQSQERVESLKLAEAQLERLKIAASNPVSLVWTSANYFCIDSSLAVKELGTNNREDFSIATYPVECQMTPAGGVVYYVSIERDASGTFAVYSKWERAGGRGRDEVRVTYRVYK